MSQQDSNTGEKTEKPTPKRLRDARKEGNVAKSRDLSQTVTTVAWALILFGLGGFFVDRMGALQEQSWRSIPDLSTQALIELCVTAGITLLWLTVLPLALVSAVGILIEFLQAGPVMSFKKIAPNFSALSPASGVKRVFAMDNFVEVFKAMLKTGVLLTITIALLLIFLDDVIKLPQTNLLAYIALDKHLLFLLTLWVAILFVALSIADWFYQRFSHERKLRMSKYDIKKEHHNQEGDPQIKGKRKQLHRQWANQSLQQAARTASAIVVNPTHVAVALYYDPEETVVPMITVKGEGPVAKLIRETAEEACVPIMRNVPLARALNFHGEEDDFIPEDYFEAVAEVLAWAEHVRQQVNQGQSVALYVAIDEQDWLH